MLIAYLLLFLFQLIQCFQTSNPVWKTSIYFRAGQESVIKTLTGNTSTPQYTFIFSSALTGVPNIAYGIGKYQGADTLVDECFEIFRIGLTSTSFSVAVQITGFTNLYILRVPYLAIEPTFPHHLNTFDNIPVNYSAGPLVNITSRSTTQRTYLNTINYTQQSAGRKYTNFTLPISRYKIVLMMTSLFVSTSGESNASQNYSMDLRLETNIISQQLYTILVRLKVRVIVNRIHYSQIVYDPVDIESSDKYKLLYEVWTVDNYGGEKTIPQEFQDNFIMAISEFTSKLGYCGFDYMWDWVQNSTFFGVKIYESITRAKLCAFVRICSSVVYIQTWQCLSPYFYFNRTTFLCQDQCGMYTYPAQKQNDIITDYLCLPCDWACSVCNSSKKCISCNSDDMRLFNGSCYCPHGYLDTLVVTKCQKCLDANCIICEKNPNYKANPLPTDPVTSSKINLCIMCEQNYILNQTTGACDEIARCNSSQNQLLNYDTNQCETCPVDGCGQCRQSMQLKFNGTVTDIMQIGMSKRVLTSSNPFGVISCVVCDQISQFFKNFTSLTCEKCTLTECIRCSSLYTCSFCNSLNQYFLNSTTKLCEKCVLQGCISCDNLTACRVCDSVAGYFLANDAKTCKFCGLGCGECLINSTETQTTSSCKTCSNGLIYNDGECTCIKGYFLQVVNSTNITCSICDPLCKQCQNSSTSCTDCYFQHNRVLSKQNNTCQCNTNYAESNNSLTCSKIDPSLPNTGYKINPSTKKIEEICGDGIRLVVECDDGNLIDTDGCSSNCKIEKNFICQTPIYDISVCHYAGNVSVLDYNITKDPFENAFDLLLSLYPQLVMYQSLDWKNGLFFGGNPPLAIIEANMKGVDKLNLKIKYFENIKNLNITLGFSSTTKSTTRLLQQTLTFHFLQTSLNFNKTTNNLEIAYYPQTTYLTVKLLQTVFKVIMILYSGLVFAAVFFFKRITPLMVMFISVQLCFISLSSIQNFQPQTFSIINNFNQVFGINSVQNFMNLCIDQRLRSQSFRNLKFQKCFVTNFNLMMIFQLVSIVGIIVMALIQFRWEKVGKKYGNYFKRALSNLIFFNLSNFVVSAGLINYDMNHKIGMGLVGFQGLLTVLQFVFIFKSRKVYLIQVDIEDYEDQFQVEQIFWQKSKDSKEQIKSKSSDSLSQAISQKHSDSNENGNLVHREVYHTKNNQNDEEQTSDQPHCQNKQIIYFALFIIIFSVGCPITYLLFCQTYPLTCNISVICTIILLIIAQILINPFTLPSEQQPFKPFPMLSYNFYITYGLTALFLLSNVMFSILQGSFGNDLDRRAQSISFLSYGQVVLFLVMIFYMTVAWGYAAYLSFFDEDILLKYNKEKEKMQNPNENQSHQSINQHQQSLSISQISVLNGPVKNYRRQISSKISKQNYTTQYSNEIAITPKQHRRIISTLQDSENLIFQMDEDSVMEDRF